MRSGDDAGSSSSEDRFPSIVNTFHSDRLAEFMEREGRPVRLAAGQDLFTDSSDEVFYLEEGEVQAVILTPNGSMKITQVMEPGTTIGEVFVFHRPPPFNSGRLVVSRPSLLFAVPAEAVKRQFMSDSEFAFDLTASISRKFHSWYRQLEDLSFRGVRRRVACLLAGLFDAQEGQDVHVSQETMGGMIGAHRVSVNGALHELEGLGAISIGEKSIALGDRTRLLEEACGTDR